MISSGLVSYLGTLIRFAGYLFLRFKDDREIRQINPSQTLMNLQYSYKMMLVQNDRGLDGLGSAAI